MKVELRNEIHGGLPPHDDHPYRSGVWRPQYCEYDAWDLDVEVPRVVFAVLGPPDAAAVGVIVVGRETAMDLVAQFDLHGSMLAHRYGDVTSAIMAQ